jgi:hypothetical protein
MQCVVEKKKKRSEIGMTESNSKNGKKKKTKISANVGRGGVTAPRRRCVVSRMRPLSPSLARVLFCFLRLLSRKRRRRDGKATA